MQARKGIEMKEEETEYRYGGFRPEATVLAMATLVEKAKRDAARRREENAKRAEEDDSPDFEIADADGFQYVRELVVESRKANASWADALREYNEAVVEYLTRKSYALRIPGGPERHTLSIRQYKEAAKAEEGRQGPWTGR